jgi:lysophospholipase L1-like esterase
MKSSSIVRFCAALVCVASALAQQAPKQRFEKEIAAFEAAELAKPSPPGGIVFTGASGIRMWRSLAEDFAGLPVINRGFGGSYTYELTDYADRMLVPLKPAVIALQPGSNDLTIGKTPEQVLADFQAFVTKVRGALPEVRIVYLGINPSPKRWEIRDAQQRTNQLIREYALTGRNLAFVDLWPSSLGPDGQPIPDFYIADQLHPTRKAYQLRAPIIRPYLSQKTESP